MADRDTNSTLVALGRGRGGEPAFLQSHHIEAALRFQRLFERSRLRPRTTMHYGPRIGGGRGGNDIGDMAADARKQLAALHGALPPDCADVLIDVFGFEKGLQDIETERGWPRRSAKLVLRIALSALASHFGLTPSTTGATSSRARTWLDESARPTEFG